MCWLIVQAIRILTMGLKMDSYIYLITALLPLVSILLVSQTNPYQALVIRGILGAVAALVYTVLGAADVALTEALVGTLLSITLYAVAVRSSFVLRLGVLETETFSSDSLSSQEDSLFNQLINDFRQIFSKYHLRLELLSYRQKEDMLEALSNKEIHALCLRSNSSNCDESSSSFYYQTVTRLHRIQEIIDDADISTCTRIIHSSSLKRKEVIL